MNIGLEVNVPGHSHQNPIHVYLYSLHRGTFQPSYVIISSVVFHLLCELVNTCTQAGRSENNSLSWLYHVIYFTALRSATQLSSHLLLEYSVRILV